MLHNKTSHCRDKPARRNKKQAPLAAARENLEQHGQKEKKKRGMSLFSSAFEYLEPTWKGIYMVCPWAFMATFIHTNKGFFHLQVNMLEASF